MFCIFGFLGSVPGSSKSRYLSLIYHQNLRITLHHTRCLCGQCTNSINASRLLDIDIRPEGCFGLNRYPSQSPFLLVFVQHSFPTHQPPFAPLHASHVPSASQPAASLC